MIKKFKYSENKIIYDMNLISYQINIRKIYFFSKECLFCRVKRISLLYPLLKVKHHPEFLNSHLRLPQDIPLQQYANPQE